MRFLPLLLLTFCITAYSYPVSKRTPKLEFTKRSIKSPKFVKRDTHENSYLLNGFVAYLMTLEVGTPAQEVEVYIDTGSADLWFQTPESLACSTSSSYSNLTSCADLGLSYYIPDDSSTAHYNDTSFVISYVSGYEVTNGVMMSDKVTAGDLTIDNLFFGVAYESNTQDNSLIGLGLDALEYNAANASYPNFVERLYTDGLISQKLYSIYLNSQFSDGGAILFGAVDDSKYVGDLVAHDLVSETEFFIQSNSTSFNGTEIIGAKPMLIDTGSTAMTITFDAYKYIVEALNASYNNDYGLYDVICEEYNTTAPALIFQFGTQEISIGPGEYLMNYNIGSNGQTEPVQNVDGLDLCFLGFSYGDDVILGDTFIRSVYAVYDLENKQLSLAKAAWVAEEDVTSTLKSAVSSSTSSLPSGSSSSLTLTETLIIKSGSYDPSSQDTLTTSPLTRETTSVEGFSKTPSHAMKTFTSTKKTGHTTKLFTTVTSHSSNARPTKFPSSSDSFNKISSSVSQISTAQGASKNSSEQNASISSTESVSISSDAVSIYDSSVSSIFSAVYNSTDISTFVNVAAGRSSLGAFILPFILVLL